jgi:hypothetical protein
LKSIALTIAYDPALLHITAVDLGPDAPPDASLTTGTGTSGRLGLTFLTGSTPLAQGTLKLITLIADVPAGAALGGSQVIDVLEVLVIDVGDAPLAATDDDAVQAIAFFGDATGNGGYSGLDAQRIARVGVGLDSGFEAYPNIDPVVVADITGNGELSGLDAQKIAKKVVGLNTPEIPSMPQPQRLDDTAAGRQLSAGSGSRLTLDVPTSGVGGTLRVPPTPEVFSGALGWEFVTHPAFVFPQTPTLSAQPASQTTRLAALTAAREPPLPFWPDVPGKLFAFEERDRWFEDASGVPFDKTEPAAELVDTAFAAIFAPVVR